MAARIAGVMIPMQKHIVIGLTAIYGIGRERAQTICDSAKVEPTKKVKDLTEAELKAYEAKSVSSCRRRLRREVAMNIKRLVELGTYRGTRHKRGLPVRGQRTRLMRELVKAKEKATNKR